MLESCDPLLDQHGSTFEADAGMHRLALRELERGRRDPEALDSLGAAGERSFVANQLRVDAAIAGLDAANGSWTGEEHRDPVDRARHPRPPLPQAARPVAFGRAVLRIRAGATAATREDEDDDRQRCQPSAEM